MMGENIHMNDTHFSRASVNKIMEALHDALKTDINLAGELITFLKERNINIPSLSNEELNKILPVSFKNKKSNKGIKELKKSFEEINNAEHIL